MYDPAYDGPRTFREWIDFRETAGTPFEDNERRRELRERVRRLVVDLPYFAKRALKIRPKEGGLIGFRMNRVQLAVHDKLEYQRCHQRRVRALILKARQPGISTYVEARFFHQILTRPGVAAYILTHEQRATDALFGMSQRYYDHLPPWLCPQQTSAANAKELRLATIDSGIQVATAGTKGAGRGGTVQLFHGSEVAHWPNAAEHMAGVLQAVPEADDTEIILESTANGVGGLFYDMCKAAERGKSEYQLIFVPWWEHGEYEAEPPNGWQPPPEFFEYGEYFDLSPRQLYWAWKKNAELATAHHLDPDAIAWIFRQEYPATAAEAFQVANADSFIRPELVMRARKATMPDQSHAPLIFGVDVAGGGKAKPHIVDRRGRCAGHLIDMELQSADTMEIVGELGRLVKLHQPDAVFIDVGYNPGVYDRCKELKYPVHAVKFGGGAHDDRYANKRAEMAGELSEWLEEGADIPDSDEWQAELCATARAAADSLSRVKLEPKEKTIDRVGLTLDRFDALLCTFAEPVRLLPAGMPVHRPARAQNQYRPHRWHG